MNRRVLAIALALMLIVGIAGYPVTALAEDEIWYTVSISVTGNGGVWMNGDKFTSSLELKENATGTIDIIPDTGYEVTHVYVDGVDQGRVRSYTFDNVQGNHSLKVVFSRIITDEISDSVLRSKIRIALGNKPSDYAITEEDMLSLTVLDAQYYIGAEITDISGLQYAENLEELYLSGNEISDITHLAGLTKLKKLSLYNNNTLSDISPLAGLTNLTDLDLYNNHISDISALSNLKKMKFYKYTATPSATFPHCRRCLICTI